MKSERKFRTMKNSCGTQRALNSAMRNATSRRAVIVEKLLVKPGGSLRK